eukprot:scaffold440465_cov31-Prasinocladus_malaysianus.AAC.1
MSQAVLRRSEAARRRPCACTALEAPADLDVSAKMIRNKFLSEAVNTPPPDYLINPIKFKGHVSPNYLWLQHCCGERQKDIQTKHCRIVPQAV